MYKEKLIYLLKSDKKVKKAMEEIGFGTIFKDKNSGEFIKYITDSDNGTFGIENNSGEDYLIYYLDSDININEYDLGDIDDSELLREEFYNNKNRDFNSDFKIIGLPLQERFIRMYCENKGLFISFDNKNIYRNFRILLENNESGIYTIDFNNNIDFDNQDDIVYQRIYEALYNLNK